jgi:nucleoside-diphosphate-sugar epimerase
MKVLFIGGTGTISLASTRAALQKGCDVFHLNRGSRPELAPPEVTTLLADIRNPDQTREALSGRQFDCVVNWVAFEPGHVEQDIELFSGSAGQYILISSASVYKKPPDYRVITESTPVGNPFWEYARKKIACEEALQKAMGEKDFPGTIVRPSYTYCDGWIPSSMGHRDYTPARRMLQGREIIVHDGGQAVWTITHSEDFAVGFTGLLGIPAALGEIFNITSDEALTWVNIHRITAEELGVEPRMVPVPSEFIKRFSTENGASLLGDKAYSTVFDNSRIKGLVPDFQAAVPFREGIRRSLAWFDDNPGAKAALPEKEALIERILDAWKKSGGGD